MLTRVLLCLALAGTVPARAEKTLRAVAVHPSGKSIPENLLRISIVFAAPPQGPVLSRLTLRRSDATLIESPFLEQELWSPDRKTLTVLLHPGRVKTGLVAYETLGRALHRDDEVTLALAGQKLKSWHVDGEARAAPEPAKWRITRALIGKRTPLQVVFDHPIDAGSAALIAVVGPDNCKVDGQVELVAGEAEWIFTPARAWNRAPYRLVVHPKLEDAAGNAIGQPFEQSIAESRDVQVIEIPIRGE